MPHIDKTDLQLIEAAVLQHSEGCQAAITKLEEEFFSLPDRTVQMMRQIADASKALGGSDDVRGSLTRSLNSSQRILEQLRALNEQGASSAEVPGEQVVTFRLLLGSAAWSAQTDAATAANYRALERRLRELR
jgi:predicted  nucleic acid-binding Zn-ribbon protein